MSCRPTEKVVLYAIVNYIFSENLADFAAQTTESSGTSLTTFSQTTSEIFSSDTPKSSFVVLTRRCYKGRVNFVEFF